MLDYLCRPIPPGVPEGEAARILLRALLTARFGAEGETLFAALRKNENGKPLLDGGLYVSLSHSHGMAAAALASAPVGIDLERILPLTENKQKLLDRFFPGEETQAAKEDPAGVEFCRFWTRREAAFKAFATQPFFVQDPTAGHSAELLTLSVSGEKGDYLLSLACPLLKNENLRFSLSENGSFRAVL